MGFDWGGRCDFRKSLGERGLCLEGCAFYCWDDFGAGYSILIVWMDLNGGPSLTRTGDLPIMSRML